MPRPTRLAPAALLAFLALTLLAGASFAADLTIVRDPSQLAKLPEGERAAWEAFWSEVRSALER